MRYARKKRRLEIRDGVGCFYCGKVSGKLTIDHKTPVVRGGGEEDENTVIACYDCNQKKGAMTAEEFLASLPLPDNNKER